MRSLLYCVFTNVLARYYTGKQHGDNAAADDYNSSWHNNVPALLRGGGRSVRAERPVCSGEDLLSKPHVRDEDREHDYLPDDR